MGRLLGRDPQHPRWGRGRPRLDGSFNGDTTVLVVATVDQRPTKPSSTGALTHSGDSRLARHIGDAVLREDARGGAAGQGTPRLPRRIDAAVAAVMAHDRAAALAGATRDSIYL